MKVCTEPGCSELVERGHCPAHKKREPKRERSTNTGHRRWRTVRARVLRSRPWCEKQCGRPSGDVHHLDGLGLRGPRAFDLDNLEALCHECHSKVTRAEQLEGRYEVARSLARREKPTRHGTGPTQRRYGSAGLQ